MGQHQNIGADRFPRQGEWLGKRVEVCFDYDPSQTIWGTFIRDDAEDPQRSIIQLDDGRVVLTTECQHRTPITAEEEWPDTISTKGWHSS